MYFQLVRIDSNFIYITVTAHICDDSDLTIETEGVKIWFQS